MKSSIGFFFLHCAIKRQISLEREKEKGGRRKAENSGQKTHKQHELSKCFRCQLGTQSEKDPDAETLVLLRFHPELPTVTKDSSESCPSAC